MPAVETAEIQSGKIGLGYVEHEKLPVLGEWVTL
jgi:hypothetical protein